MSALSLCRAYVLIVLCLCCNAAAPCLHGDQAMRLQSELSHFAIHIAVRKMHFNQNLGTNLMPNICLRSSRIYLTLLEGQLSPCIYEGILCGVRRAFARTFRTSVLQRGTVGNHFLWHFGFTVCVPPTTQHSCFLQTCLCGTCDPLISYDMV